MRLFAGLLLAAWGFAMMYSSLANPSPYSQDVTWIFVGGIMFAAGVTLIAKNWRRSNAGTEDHNRAARSANGD